MPSLGGATEWLNSEPLGPAELRGHVVLVNFWTLTCINWLRTEPYVRAWSQAYRDDGLIVIGVHTPEFSFEHEIDRVRQATKERGIDYPVAVDNDYAIWSAFDNHYWPALYFVDADGIIRDHHFGEGRYEQSERVIQRLLGVERELVSVEGLGVEAEADWDHLRTPETYLGYGRSEQLRVTGRRRVRRAPRLRAPRAPALQPLGARRRVDDRAREGRARPGRREHRLPLPRARRASRAVCRSAGADPVPRAPRRRGSGPVARRGRRRGRERRCSGTAACTSSCASTTRSASGRWRSRSSSPAPRRTCSRSGSQNWDIPDRPSRIPGSARTLRDSKHLAQVKATGMKSGTRLSPSTQPTSAGRSRPPDTRDSRTIRTPADGSAPQRARPSAASADPRAAKFPVTASTPIDEAFSLFFPEKAGMPPAGFEPALRP